jgi:polyhydroxyalkanoate synthesis repressor PhaR
MEMSKDSAKSGDAIIIKKYANRRLYDTSSSQYVTLDHLRDLVKRGVDFAVVDAKSGEDLTRGVLAQIIFEEEARGANLLPVDFLRQLISFYGDSLQSVVPGYLNVAMSNFAQQQEEFRKSMTDAISSPQSSMAMMQELTERNMEMFGNAMRMFAPFPGTGAAMAEAQEGESAAEAQAEQAETGEDLAALRAEMAAMQEKLEGLIKK